MISARMTKNEKPITRWDNKELGRIVIHAVKDIDGQMQDEFLCLESNSSVIIQGDTQHLCEALAWLRGEGEVEVHFD